MVLGVRDVAYGTDRGQQRQGTTGMKVRVASGRGLSDHPVLPEPSHTYCCSRQCLLPNPAT